MLALAGVMGPATGPATGAPAVRLIVALPDPLKAAILGLFAMTALLFLGFMFPRGLRRRKKEDEEFQLVYEHPKVSPWALLLVLVLFLVPVGLAGYYDSSGSRGCRRSQALCGSRHPLAPQSAPDHFLMRLRLPSPRTRSLPGPSRPWLSLLGWDLWL